MAEPSSPDELPSRTGSESGSGHGSSDYWCYHCDKRVAVETVADLPDVVCCECNNGFVEPISAATGGAPDAVADLVEDLNFGSQFIQVLRLIAEAAREEEEEAPPPPPPPPSDPADYRRIELDGWGNGSDGDDDDAEHSVEVFLNEETDGRERYGGENRSDGEEDEEIEVIEAPRDGDEDGEERMMRRRVRDALRLRPRDILSRAASRRNRILHWADILMGLENHSIELRLQVPGSDDDYIGNSANYVDAAGYEALLQNLTESDGDGRRGAPPASKAAVEALENVVITDGSGSLLCAVCKDVVNVGETVKNLPCGHGYHCECIIPWLGSRNSCPVCRFELPTDDAEYEEERRKRAGSKATSSSSSSLE